MLIYISLIVVIFVEYKSRDLLPSDVSLYYYSSFYNILIKKEEIP